jgi:hypothetical protein
MTHERGRRRIRSAFTNTVIPAHAGIHADYPK